MLRHKIIIMASVALAFIVVGAAIFFTCRMQRPEDSPDIALGISGDRGLFGDDVTVHDSTDGEIVIKAAQEEDNQLSDIIMPLLAAKTIPNPDNIWESDAYAGNHTPAEKAQMKSGSVGVLTIPKLYLSVNVYESRDSMEDMSKGVAHFPSTSAFDSNVGLSAHNVNLDGSDGYFKYLHTLEKGDDIIYKTALGERSYNVASITTIDETDWTSLHYTDDNRLTMITCISGQPNKRLCVQAIESGK